MFEYRKECRCVTVWATKALLFPHLVTSQGNINAVLRRPQALRPDLLKYRHWWSLCLSWRERGLPSYTASYTAVCSLRPEGHKEFSPVFDCVRIAKGHVVFYVINLHLCACLICDIFYKCLHVVCFCTCTCIKPVFIVILCTYACMAVCLFVFMVLDACEWAYRHVLCQIYIDVLLREAVIAGVGVVPLAAGLLTPVSL